MCVRSFEAVPNTKLKIDNAFTVTIRLGVPRLGEVVRSGVVAVATLLGFVAGGPSGALVTGAIAAAIAFRMGAEIVIGLALGCLALTAVMNAIGQAVAEEALASDAFVFLAAGVALSVLGFHTSRITER